MANETVWKAALQVEEWAGEVRVNAIRVLAIVAFYAQHLVNIHIVKEPLGPAYHLAITAIALGWVATAVTLHLALGRRYRPAWLPYAVVSADLLLVTLLLMVSDGPQSALLVLLLLVVATTAVRLNLALVRTATALAAFAYGAVLVHAYEFRPEWVVPRRQQVIFTLALGCAGLLAGQSVRRARRLAADYHDRIVFLAAQPGAPEGGRS